MKPNPDQLKYIQTKEGRHRILAGPGSGKTSTTIERFKFLVNENIHPSDILCLTFTNTSAADMAKKAGVAKESFRTFHSFGYEILQKENGRVPVEPELRLRLLSKLSRKWSADYKELSAFISKMRRNRLDPQQAEKINYILARAYGEYEQERRMADWLDFDSMLVDPLRLLEKPNVRARYQKKFVMVDEAQDTCPLQMNMVELISEQYKNVCIIGDPNQSIYQWRDAAPEILLNNNGETICLGINYRSTTRIVDYIKQHTPVKTPLTDAMQAHSQAQGEPVEYKMYPNDLAEAEAAVAVANSDPLNSAILARTNRLLAPLENCCLEHSIRYQTLGTSGFWVQSEIRKAVERLGQYKHVPAESATKIVVADVSRFYQVDDATKEDNEALANLQTLVQISKRFTSIDELIRYAIRASHAKKQKGLTIGTVHSAKGLEWDNVIVIGVREGVLPHAKGDPEEEARIFYVAISRAAKRLRLSFTGSPSPLIKSELTDEILLQLRNDYDKVEKLVSQEQFNFG